MTEGNSADRFFTNFLKPPAVLDPVTLMIKRLNELYPLRALVEQYPAENLLRLPHNIVYGGNWLATDRVFAGTLKDAMEHYFAAPSKN